MVGPRAKTTAVDVEARIDSHDKRRTISAVWYDLKTFGGLREESRLVGWGSSSPVTSPEITGALLVLVFRIGAPEVAVWICRDQEEADVVSEVLGPVEPGWGVTWRPTEGRPHTQLLVGRSLVDSELRIPDSWRTALPTPEQIFGRACELEAGGDADGRLMTLRQAGLALLDRAVQSLANGPSMAAVSQHARALLELQISRLAVSACDPIGGGVTVERDRWPISAEFDHTHRSGRGARPLLRVVSAIDGNDWRSWFPAEPGAKYLMTLQEGMDLDTCASIAGAGIQLVVPEPIWHSYPSASRAGLMSVAALVRTIADNAAARPQR
jgi:hypothetical protein